MGGFMGWYKSQREAEIESFKAGCDMMLWPNQHYVDDMVEAVENGYIPMERLDDAVTRILEMKEKLGLFEKDNHAIKLSKEDQKFIKKTQQETAEHSVTLIRDEGNFFPLSLKKHKKIAVIPVTHHEPAFEEAEMLCEELRSKGFQVDYYKEMLTMNESEKMVEEHDLVIYALFSRPFRPMGFLDFLYPEANKVASCCKWGVEKTMVVSFGSPYFGNQYFERAVTYVNAYSMLSPSVKAFVRAAMGEIEFSKYSPVEL